VKEVVLFAAFAAPGPIPDFAALPPDPPAVSSPAGYPPPPPGFRWETYPDGRWGLVQAGLAVPAATQPAEARGFTNTTPPPVSGGTTCAPGRG
jgi:hypothetical protein